MFFRFHRALVRFRKTLTWRIQNIPYKDPIRSRFPSTQCGQTAKGFLGSVNYIRDFVRNHSLIIKRLHDFIANYYKSRRIWWSPETPAAFHEMKLQVSKCSTMSFLSDTAPITFQTDAPDYYYYFISISDSGWYWPTSSFC